MVLRTRASISDSELNASVGASAASSAARSRTTLRNTLRVTGTGTLFFHAYGDVAQVDVNGEYVVDNGYAVAWEPTLTYRLTRSRRIRSFLFADQLLLRFSGRGRIWVQSRSPRALANWVHPFRRVESKSD